MRSAADRRGPPELAVSAGSPYRCVCADSESMAGQMKLRMPAEWEPHAATWLAWPHEKSDWPGKFEPIPWLYGEIVRYLARVERVRIITENASRVRAILRKCGADLNAVEVFPYPTNRSWTRDYCP